MNRSQPVVVSPPSLALLGTEPWRAAREFMGLRSMPEAPAPGVAQGDGHPVVIFPGLATDGHAVAPLRAYCERLGYAAMDWGRGWNTGPRGDIDQWLRQLAQDVAERLGDHAAAPTLIGWSLGGIYARELAKLPGFRARQVITIGTPFNGIPEHTHVSMLYHLLGGSPQALDPGLRSRLRKPPPVPTTSIYSRTDGIVAWEACRHDKPGPAVQDIAVESSHLGMGWNPSVLRVVADRLAQPAASWRPYIGDEAR